VHHTREVDDLASALLPLIGFFNSPRQDEVLLNHAGVSLDRALFPLLVRIGSAGAVGVTELADRVGRDHSTVSRQVAKLETLGLITRQLAAADQRVREARLTRDGQTMIEAITKARRQLLSELLDDWTDEDRKALARLLHKFVASLLAQRNMAQERHR
jgi:DNA-binding MarR family transcriptional regulator